jgi:hypothetical protein
MQHKGVGLKIEMKSKCPFDGSKYLINNIINNNTNLFTSAVMDVRLFF